MYISFVTGFENYHLQTYFQEKTSFWPKKLTTLGRFFFDGYFSRYIKIFESLYEQSFLYLKYISKTYHWPLGGRSLHGWSRSWWIMFSCPKYFHVFCRKLVRALTFRIFTFFVSQKFVSCSTERYFGFTYKNIFGFFLPSCVYFYQEFNNKN